MATSGNDFGPLASHLGSDQDAGSDQRAERTRDDISHPAVSIERLTLELEKPSAYSETLKSLNRRLDEVSTELLGAVKVEDVVADSNAIKREDAEPPKRPRKLGRPRWMFVPSLSTTKRQ